MSTSARSAVHIDVQLGSREDRSLAYDVLDGLTRPFKEIPPKHLYDTEGSRLFDAICGLPEYYQTRTERAILEGAARALVRATGASELVELGSGVPTKTRLLLDAMQEAGTLALYVPVDVSEAVLRASAEQLVEHYPGLRVHGLLGDFERHLDALPAPEGPRLVAFLGGTIGNFLPGSRRRFLRGIARPLRPQDRLVLGVDLVKDPAVLEAAYNDPAGVTAAFNRNVLAVINRELGGDFDLGAFEHVAFYDRHHEWIEMRLRALAPQVVRIERLGLTVHFANREELRTEVSAKFTPARLDADLAAAGLEPAALLTDPRRLFAVSISRPADPCRAGA
jgi:L-histidine N-alpha-methyltransferase